MTYFKCSVQFTKRFEFAYFLTELRVQLENVEISLAVKKIKDLPEIFVNSEEFELWHG